MIRIFIKRIEVPNGPFPLTALQLKQARNLYQAEWAACAELSGVKASPQTTARALLHQVAPLLSDFDAMMVGFAVSSKDVSTEEA